MGLHDRINGPVVVSAHENGADGSLAAREVQAGGRVAKQADPYADLKSRVHHACIARLGPELFASETTDDLEERVMRTVMEQLALDRTPLTREERRQIVADIADDILGYGPLEPFLRDDTVTEIMVNGPTKIFVERTGKIESTDASFVDDGHLLRIIDKIVSQIGRRVDESSPMVDAAFPTAAV